VTDLSEVEIRNYLFYLVERKKVSTSYQNQAINAIKFFYEKIMWQERKIYYLEITYNTTTITHTTYNNTTTHTTSGLSLENGMVSDKRRVAYDNNSLVIR
jgi:hypothetical protein